MGEKLIEYYKIAEELGGKKAQMRLGLITCVPLIFAKVLEDSPESIEMFENALIEIRLEHKNEDKGGL